MRIVLGTALAMMLAASGSVVAHADGSSSCADSPASQAEWNASWAVYQAEQHSPIDPRISVTVDLPVTINSPLAHVWAVYSNLQNDVGRHPFLTCIVTHHVENDPGVQIIDFTAMETIPIGPIGYPGHTQAEQRIYAADHYYTTDSWDAPSVTTHQRVIFVDNGNGTTSVNEHITFVSDPATIKFTVDNGTSSHQADQAALKRDIENGTL